MHVAGDLGFSSLVLVVCLVFPVIAFIIRRKWRLAVARKEEIKRLLVLASEEAARAELEATLSYSAVPSLNNYQCAVCYYPTTTRCSRCKAVRYCSHKCQYIHWRQGHKEECRPPSCTLGISDDDNSFDQNVTKQFQHDTCNDRSEKAGVEVSSQEPSFPSSSRSPGMPYPKDNHGKIDPVADTGMYSCSESSTSFSGFSSSPTGGESSDDVSVSESISSSETEGTDGQVSTGIIHDMLESSLEKVDNNPLSPKFGRLFDSVDSINKSSKLNQVKCHVKDGESKSVPTSSSHITNSAAMPDKISSGFWDRTLVTDVPSCDAYDDSTSDGDAKCSNSESFLNFKFDLVGGNDPMLYAQGLEKKVVISDDANPAVLGISRPVDKATSSGNAGVDGSKGRESLSLNYDGSNHVNNHSSGDSNVSKFNENKAKPLPCSSAYPSSGTRGAASVACESEVLGSPSSDFVVNDFPISSSLQSKSRSSASASQMASRSSGHVVPMVKTRKVDEVEVGSATASQMMSSSTSSINGLKSSVLKVVDQFRGSKCGRYSDKGLFPYDRFVKLYNSNKVEMRPCGLINCGNSCYANAVLQCLTFTPPLTAYFVQGFHSKECVNKEWCFTCKFENLISKAKEGKSPLSPIGILSQLQNSGSHLVNGKEEDAHEFLRYAIDIMQSVCLKEAGMSASGSFEEETTLIGLTFGGYLRSKIECLRCQYKSERQERMMDLAVEIEGDVRKLEDALKRFTGTEVLDGDNKYQCSRCKSYQKAKKKLKILEAPNVLTIALKRFQSGKFGKLNKPIRFPEILDLAPYMSGTSDKSPIYSLYGVIVHLDIMNDAFSGHYVCYVKNIQNKWFKIDDSTVTSVELESVLTEGAYMLFYSRCSPRAPRLIRSQIVSPDHKSKGIPSRINTKNLAFNSRYSSTRPSVVQFHPDSISADNMASVESFYLKFHQLQKILEEDSSSDNYSFTSNSDEGSCSTDSTRDSTSTDDISDYIFGGWSGSWRNTSGSDTSSSSSSPLYLRQSPLADMDRNASGSPEISSYRTGHGYQQMENGGVWDEIPNGGRRAVNLEGKRGDSFSLFDTAKQCRKTVNSSSSSSSSRETDSVRVGSVKHFSDVKSFRRSMSERTD